MTIEVPTPRELDRARRKAGLTQAEVARQADISQPAVSKALSRENDPRLSTVQKIADAINSEL
jgi:predicted transcriptional regulator